MKLTGAEIVAEHLIAEGCPYVLGIPGHGSLALADAFRTRQDRITTLQMMHESAGGPGGAQGPAHQAGPAAPAARDRTHRGHVMMLEAYRRSQRSPVLSVLLIQLGAETRRLAAQRK